MRITASHIIEWANTRAKEAQADLPRLIRRLCFDATTTRRFSFPAGDSTYLPGWDGLLSCEQGNTWVPVGESRWEFGCDQGITAKANQEYRKRTVQTDTEERSLTTFVFVTPRRWTKKSAWTARQHGKGEWAEVRAYDADDLEQWLEQTPAVALQFAEELGLSGWGVESLSRYWQLWSQQCRPAITPDALFMDRAPARDSLVEKIRQALSAQHTISPLVIRADSVEEAAAFTVAVVLSTDDLADQALVVTAPEGWRFVAANRQLQIAIAANTEVATTPTLSAGLLTVIPHAAGDVAGKPKGDAVILERQNIQEFEKALITIGVDESEAKRYAVSTGRSWTVFRRQCAINPALRRPAWLEAPQSEALATLCLLGAWNADKDADRRVVEQVAARPYDDIEQDLRFLAGLDDAPLLMIGSVWKAKAPLELLRLFGDRLTSGQLDRFFAMALELFTAPDPQLELPDEERYMAQIHGKVRPQSGLLFNSISDTLVKLAVRGPEQPGLLALRIEGRVAALVREVLDDADGERWLSLASYLPTLAEAAPGAFLAAVEKSLGQPDAPVTRLLTETSNATFGGCCWHAGLLWALETVAWAPRQLARTVLILAKLSHVPVKGNWSNSPTATLLSLFLSWFPQTAAGLQERIQVLDLLIDKEPDVAFTLLEGLTARGPQFTSSTARPKWREDDAGAGHGVTHTEMKAMHTAATERLFRLSGNHAPRIAALFQHLSPKNDVQMSTALALMKPFTLPEAGDEDREILRSALRSKIHWYREYDDAPKERLDEWLRGIESCYERLAPLDLICRHRWLFKNHWVDLPVKVRKRNNVEVSAALLAQARTAALSEIRQELGMVGIEKFMKSCAQPYIIGATLAGMAPPKGDWAQWIVEKGGEFTQGLPTTLAIAGLLGTLPTRHASSLLREVMALGEKLGWNAERRGRFLILARPMMEPWQLAAAYGPDTEFVYWENVQLGSCFGDDADDELKYVLQHLLKVDRPLSALQYAQYMVNRIPADLLYSLMQQFLAGQEPEGPRPDSWHLTEMLEHLEQSGEIEKMALIQLEFALLPALGHGGEAKATVLYEGLMTDPALFSELICLCYKPEHGDREKPVSEATRTAARHAWRVLRACRRQPGTQRDGVVDQETFIHFIDEAHALCHKADRLTMCDQTLGQILAHTPEDEDGTWPCAPAREVLDRPEQGEMRSGFTIGVRNKRGTTTRSPWEGGDQERDLAVYYRKQAERVQHSHPYVAAVLEELAKSYEHDGSREDDQARLRKEGY